MDTDVNRQRFECANNYLSVVFAFNVFSFHPLYARWRRYISINKTWNFHEKWEKSKALALYIYRVERKGEKKKERGKKKKKHLSAKNIFHYFEQIGSTT